MNVGFENGRFDAEVRRTATGAIRISVRPRKPTRRGDTQRELASFIDELAWQLEWHRDGISGACWVIAPATSKGYVDVELDEKDDEEAAKRFVDDVIAEVGLWRKPRIGV